MGEPYWSVGGENDGPGQEDGGLGDGNSPVDQGGDREHYSQEPKQMDQSDKQKSVSVKCRRVFQIQHTLNSTQNYDTLINIEIKIVIRHVLMIFLH